MWSVIHELEFEMYHMQEHLPPLSHFASMHLLSLHVRILLVLNPCDCRSDLSGPFQTQSGPLEPSEPSVTLLSKLSHDSHVISIHSAYSILFLDLPSVTTSLYMAEIPDPCNPSNNLTSVLLCPPLMPSAVYTSILFSFLSILNHMSQL